MYSVTGLLSSRMAELYQPDSKHCIDDLVYAVTFKHFELTLHAAAVQVYCPSAHHLEFQVPTKVRQFQCIKLLGNSLTDDSVERTESNPGTALVQKLTVEPHVRLECMDGDINTFLCSYGSVGGDINVRSGNFTSNFGGDIDMHSGNFTYFASVNNSISEALDYIHKKIHSVEQQTAVEEQTTTNLKADIGETFTELLIHLCVLLLKAIDDQTVNLVRNCKGHKQNIIRELAASIMILMNIKEKFCSEHIDQEEKDDFLQHALLPILLSRANEIVDIIRNTWQPFWKRLSSQNLSTLLSMYDELAQAVKGIEDIEHRPFCKLISDIQQLKACLDTVYNIFQRTFNSQLMLRIVLEDGETVSFIIKTDNRRNQE